MSQEYYSTVFQSVFTREIEKISRSITRGESLLIFFHEGNHSDLFFRYLERKYKIKNVRELNTLNGTEGLPLDLQQSGDSSSKFLSSLGSELWQVSSQSHSRVHDVMRKTLKKEDFPRCMLYYTIDKELYDKYIKISIKDKCLEINGMIRLNFTNYANYYLSSKNIPNKNYFDMLQYINIDTTMLNLESLIEELRSTIMLANKLDYSNMNDVFSIELFEKLIIIINNYHNINVYHNIENLYDIVIYLQEYIKNTSDLYLSLDFIIDSLSNKYNYQKLDILYFLVCLNSLNIIIINPTNKRIYFMTDLKYIMNRLYKISIETMTYYDGTNLLNKKIELDLINHINVNTTKYESYKFEFERKLTTDITTIYYLFLHITNNLKNISADYKISTSLLDIHINKEFIYDESEYRKSWNYASDLFQNIDSPLKSIEILPVIFSTMTKCNFNPITKLYTDVANDYFLLKYNELNTFLQNFDENSILLVHIHELIREVLQSLHVMQYIQNNIDGDTLKLLLFKILEIYNRIMPDINDENNYHINLHSFYNVIFLVNLNVNLKISILRQINDILHFNQKHLTYNAYLNELKTHSKNLNNNNYSTINDLFMKKIIDNSLEINNYISHRHTLFQSHKRAIAFKNLFQSEFLKFHSHVSSKKIYGVMNSILIKDIINHGFGLYSSEYLDNPLADFLDIKFDDILLAVIDAMPHHFIDLYRKNFTGNILLMPGFSIIPSETAPGHTSIITGLPPSKSHIFSNKLVTRDSEQSLVKGSKTKNIPDEIKELYSHSILYHLKTAGINSTIFLPRQYSKSMLTKIMLGSDFKTHILHYTSTTEDIFREASMIPTVMENKQFYLLMDGELDSTHHSKTKRYFFDDGELDRITTIYDDYYRKTSGFIETILSNANKKKRKILIIVTSDHGYTSLQSKNTHLESFFNGCGLEFLSTSGKVFHCPQTVTLKLGLYSKYNTTLFQNSSLCKKLKITQKYAMSSKIISLDIHSLNHIKRVICFYSNIENVLSYVSGTLRCENCGFSEIVVLSDNNVCPSCGDTSPTTYDLKPLKDRFISESEKYGIYIQFPQSTENVIEKTGVTTPIMLAFPGVDEIFAQYPSNPREMITYILKEYQKPMRFQQLQKQYFDLSETSTDVADGVFRSELENLVNLRVVKREDDEYSAQVLGEYSGKCTYLSHGSFSPNETIVPFIFIKN